MEGGLRETDTRPDAARPAPVDRALTPHPVRPVVGASRAAAAPRNLQLLQASAGNAAVARMLSRPAAPPARPTPARAPAPSAPTVARVPDQPTPETTPEAAAVDEAHPEVEDARTRPVTSSAAADPTPPPDPTPGGHPAVQRKVAGADFPGVGLLLDGVRAIPGYRLMAQITGEDPITGDRVTTGRADFVQTLLAYGPFAGAVGPVLQAMSALDDVFILVQGRLAQHNLTLARIEHDIGAAWDEVHVANGIDANVAVIRRYVAAFLADVRAFATSVVTDVLAAVRRAAVAFAKPLVQNPTVKPVWDLGTKVFHYDPLTGEAVNAPTVEILGDFLHLIGKDEALAQMRERGTLQKTADWLDTQFATFLSIKGQATALFTDAWAAISPENLPHLVENLHALAQRAFSLLGQVGSFATTVLTRVVSLIKDALLGMLSEKAHETRGFTALTVMLGRDPFTNAPVPRSPANLIKAFITLLPNGDQVFQQLSESGVIGNAAARIESEMTRLGISWEMVTGTFTAIWDTLSLADLANPIGAFLRILNQFEEPLGRIVSFAGTVLQVVIELILKLMNFPSELLGDIIAKAMAAIEDIKRDPIQFLQNIVQAMKQGVMGFLDKIGGYLLHGLTDWLFRGMRGMGIEPPKDLSLQSIITFVLQVLGVTEQKLWDQLARKIGADKVAKVRAAIDRLGQAWQFVKDVQERGIAAIWEFIQGKLSNLWDMILEKAKNWIMSEIIDKVTAKLLSMLDPTGIMAVVNSCIAFFNAVQSAIEYLREILQIIDKYVSTIASIARGDVAPGAKMLEEGLAQAVPVAIGFLANQVGLGNVPEKVAEILHGFQGMVDEAFTWLVDQAWSMGQAAINALIGGRNVAGTPDDQRTPEQKQHDLDAGLDEADALLDAHLPEEDIRQRLPVIKARHHMQSLDLIVDSQAGDLEQAHVQGQVNPSGGKPSKTVSKRLTAAERAARRNAELADLIRQRPDLLTDAGQAHYAQDLGDRFRRIVEDYHRGKAPDGGDLDPGYWRGVNGRQPPRNRIDDAVDRVTSTLAEVRRTMNGTAEARLAGLLELQRRIASLSDEIRAHVKHFDVSVSPEQPSANAQIPGITESTFSVAATGQVTDGIFRRGYEAILPAAGELGVLDGVVPQLQTTLATMLRSYHRAHLVGPGFGTELSEGIMFAPRQINLGVQNSVVEEFIRTAAAAGGVTVMLNVRANGRRLQVPRTGGSPHAIDVLLGVTYTMTVSRGSKSRTLTFAFTVAPPPSGTPSITTNDIPADVAGGEALAQVLAGRA